MNIDQLRAENEELRLRLDEAEETFRAIRTGAVDAVVVGEAESRRVYTLDGADRAYRIWVEQMSQGAVTLSLDGTIAYCNLRLSKLLHWPCEKLVGSPLRNFVHESDRPRFDDLRRSHDAPEEFTLVRSDGVLLPVLLAFTILPLEGGAALGVLITDLTSQKHHEKLAAALTALRQSEERYRTHVEQVKDYAIFQMDTRGVATTWNEGVRHVLGFEESEFIGIDVVHTIFTPEDVAHEVPQKELAHAAKHGTANNDRWMRKKNGKHFWAMGMTTALNEDGRHVGFTKVMRDQTDWKRAEENLARLTEESERQRRIYETALSNNIDFNYVFDLQGRFTYSNNALLALLRKSLSEVVGHDFHELDYPPELADKLHRQIQEVIQTQSPLRDETPFTSADGERIYEYIFVPVIGSNGVEAVAGTTRDITERKQAELALLEADRRKDEFLATLAHELRNPLAPMRTGLQVLKMAPPNSSDSIRAREMIERQLQHMVRLIDDLLDLSRITSGKVDLKPERLELRAVITSALETSRPLIESARHEVSLKLPPEPIWLNADFTRLAQVFSNLLNNAAKYTPEGGRIEVSARVAGDRVEVALRDNGVGIPAEMLPQVFEMFTQVGRSIDRAQGGLGIGLTLVRRLLELHGASIRAESDGPGHGSTFIVSLALAARPDVCPSVLPSTKKPTTIPRRKVLIVDDNQDAAESLAMLLNLTGHQARTAHSGAAALAAIRDMVPDVIFLDLGLPGMNGYEVARILREELKLTTITLVALTGWGTEEDRRQTAEAGFDHHLTKPVATEQLQSILANLKARL